MWTREDARVEKTAIDSYLRGELGALREAKPDLAGSAIVLTIEHDGHAWIGLVPLEVAPERLTAIVELLRAQRGCPIQELAGLALPD